VQQQATGDDIAQQRQKQQQQQGPVQQVSLQHTVSDYLDCDELYSGSEQEGGSCTDSGSEQQHEEDELPLIAPAWTPDHTFKVR
jgi:hypothetical protein